MDSSIVIKPTRNNCEKKIDEVDKEDIKNFRKVEEEKYINKFRKKQKKGRNSACCFRKNDREEEKQKHEEKKL